MRPWPIVGACALVLALLSPGTALAEPVNAELVCPAEPERLSGVPLLRALSLDLRGDLPTMEEMEALRVADKPEALLESLVNEWLVGEDFAERVLRHHRDLLWLNTSNVGLFTAGVRFTSTVYDVDGESVRVYWRRNRATNYRGAAESCLPQPAEYDEHGDLITTTNEDGVIQEGYVSGVVPYWDPSVTLNVCGFDAQPHLVSPAGVPCGTRDGMADRRCGCGPDLRWCTSGGGVEAAIHAAFTEDISRRIRSMVVQGRSYLELFEGPEAWVNGPLAWFYRHQFELGGGVRNEPASFPAGLLPDLAWGDADTWVRMELPPHHAGVLSSPSFLLRFQTNRSRANRFYNSFLCQPFQAPEVGLPVPTDADALNPDVQKRPGCAYCHAQLEPAAAYWGRWTEQGSGWLSPALFPAFSEECFECATTTFGCSDDCIRHYTRSALGPVEIPYLGWLKAYTFRDAEQAVNVETGPRLLVTRSVSNGTLPRCVAKKTATWLLGRSPSDEEAAWVDELAIAFLGSGFDYSDLVRRIVSSDTYRRVR